MCNWKRYEASSFSSEGWILAPIKRQDIRGWIKAVSGQIKVKLEGSGKVGERDIGIAGIRDPYAIANIDQAIAWARSQVITKTAVAKPYRIPEKRIFEFVEFDPGNAIKFTIYRSVPRGSPGETDISGCQQYPPLLGIEIPIAEWGK